MAAKNARRKRRCRKKVGHATQEAAIVARRRMYRQDNVAYGSLNVYRCKYCGKFHVGRKKLKYLNQ